MNKIYLIGAFFVAVLLPLSCKTESAKEKRNSMVESHYHTKEEEKEAHIREDMHEHEYFHDSEHTHPDELENGQNRECESRENYKYEESSAPTFDEIIFPAAQAKTAGVKVSVIHPQTFRQVIPTSGQILAAQGEETTVVANVAGKVSFKTTLTEGIPVKNGTPLFILSSENMADGDPVQRTKIAYETARQEYERAKGLLESKIVSEKEFLVIQENYENARLSYEAVAKHQTSKGQVVVSPLNGYIKNCLVNEGEYVQAGQPLINITQNRRLFLRADVSEKYYPYLPTITSANIKTPYNDKIYELSKLNGRVLSYGKSSVSSYYLPVTFEFDNKGEMIPGSYVEVYLLSTPLENVLALPHSAITEEQGLYFIYLQMDADGYKKQEVTLGADNGKEVQILTGLKAGDKAVTEGAYQVKLAGASHAIPAHSHEH